MRSDQPVSTSDLSPTELRFVRAMQRIGFGRIESIQITGGEFILDPWPPTWVEVKFCAQSEKEGRKDREFSLKQQVVELIAYVRRLDTGEIRRLQIRNGLPFSMEIGHGLGSSEDVNG